MKINLIKEIKILKIDRIDDYGSTKLNAYYENHSVIHEVKPSYSPKSNDVSERKNKILKNMVNAKLISFEAPFNLYIISYAIVNVILIRQLIIYRRAISHTYHTSKCKVPYRRL